MKPKVFCWAILLFLPALQTAHAQRVEFAITSSVTGSFVSEGEDGNSDPLALSAVWSADRIDPSFGFYLRVPVSKRISVSIEPSYMIYGNGYGLTALNVFEQSTAPRLEHPENRLHTVSMPLMLRADTQGGMLRGFVGAGIAPVVVLFRDVSGYPRTSLTEGHKHQKTVFLMGAVEAGIRVNKVFKTPIEAGMQLQHSLGSSYNGESQLLNNAEPGYTFTLIGARLFGRFFLR